MIIENDIEKEENEIENFYIEEVISKFKSVDIENYMMYKSENLSDRDIYHIVTASCLKSVYNF